MGDIVIAAVDGRVTVKNCNYARRYGLYEQCVLAYHQ